MNTSQLEAGAQVRVKTGAQVRFHLSTSNVVKADDETGRLFFVGGPRGYFVDHESPEAGPLDWFEFMMVGTRTFGLIHRTDIQLLVTTAGGKVS